MKAIAELVEEASEVIGVKRVFGEPYVKNGVTVIPAARIMGGAGGGEGTGPAIEGAMDEKQVTGGAGGGFGMGGSPAGVYVIRGDQVSWVPAIDVNRMLFGFQLVLVVFFLVARSIVKARADTARASTRGEEATKG